MPLARVPGMRQPSSNLSPEELSVWDEGDSYSIPPPNMRDANDDLDTVQGAPRPATAFDRYNESVRRSAEHAKTAPRESEFRPNKWQRLAAVGANFAAGYVNAGGRTRVDPGAMQAVNNSLLRPGYDRAQKKWEEQGRVLQADERATGMEAQSEAAKTKRQMEMERAEAYGKAQESLAATNAARLKKLNAPPGRFEKTPIGMFDNETKAYVPPPPKDPGKVAEAPTAAISRRTEEVKTMTHLTPEQKETYVLTGKVPAAPRPRATGGRSREDRPRVGTPGQFDSVDEKTSSDYSRIEREAIKRLKDAGLTGWSESDPWKYSNDGEKVKVDAVKSWLADQKNNIAAKYASRVKRFGGSAEPVKYGSEAERRGSMAGVKIGDERTYNGGTYRFDGNQWVLK